MKSKWRAYHLDEITELVIDYRGKTPKKLGGDWSESGYRALSAKNIKTGHLVQPDTIRFVSEEMYHKWMKDEIQRGDIIITSEAPFGQILYWDSEEKIVLSQRLFGVRVKKEYDSKFVYYYMTTSDFQGEMDGRATGTTVVGLRQSELMKCVVRCPNLDTQKKIASILSSIDEKILINDKINENLEQQARAVFQAWFIDYEPFGGAAPLAWHPSTLGQIAELKTDSWSPAKNPDVMVEHYSIPAFDDQHYPVFEIAAGIKSNKYILNSNSVMISKLNPDTKRIWRPLCLSAHSVCSTEFIVYEAKKQEQRDYIYSILDSIPFLNHLCSHTTGSTNSRQRATPKSTLDFTLCLPPDSIIEDFCQIVTPMYDLIASNIVENQSLAKTRDSLLPRLMSGELDVSTIEL